MKAIKTIIVMIMIIFGGIFCLTLIALFAPFLLLGIFWAQCGQIFETEAEKNQRLKDEWRGVF
jgi:hypothetical protein